MHPSFLCDVAMLTLFIGPRRLPVDDPNGTNWELRAYRELVEISEPPPARADDPKCRKGEQRTQKPLPIRQVDGENRIGFGVGYGGILYIGRRRAEGSDTWHADWQSM